MKVLCFSHCGPVLRTAMGLNRTVFGIPARLLFLLVLCLTSGIFFGSPALAGGESSVSAPLATRSLLLDADVVSSSGRICAVGERGHVLLSDDNGASWRQIQVPTRVTLTGVVFHDHLLGCWTRCGNSENS